MQICHTEKSRSSSPSNNVFANQVESWDDEAAANAEEGDDHGLVLQQQIAKERELATKVVKMIRIVVVPLVVVVVVVVNFGSRIAKERELATKVVKIIKIVVVPLIAIIMSSNAGKLRSS